MFTTPAPQQLGLGESGPPLDQGRGQVIPLRPAPQARQTRVIAVTSGKGGVGKSVISANLGVCLARSGRRVLLVDADLALANLDLMLGVRARSSIREVLNARLRIEDVLVEGPSGVCLIPACSGDATLADVEEHSRLALMGAIDSLEDRFDTLVVDTGAGIGSNAVAFAAAAQQTLVVVTPDPASLADAYAMIKILSTRCGLARVYLCVNMASGPREADQVVERLLGLVQRFLNVSVVPIGYLYRDEAVERSVKACQSLIASYPQAAIASSLQALADRLIEDQPVDGAWGGPRLFWKRLVGLSPEGSR
jgi:flagellar biosynthesis protein FlhG